MPDWVAEHAALSVIDAPRPEDLERLALAATMLGRDGEVPALRERALRPTSSAATVSRPLPAASG